MYLDVLLKHKDGWWEWDRVRQEVSKVTEQLAYWGVDYMSFIKSFVSKLIKRRKVRAIWEDMLVANLAMAFLKETISSFSDDLSKINSANGSGKQFEKFMQRTVVRALTDIVANTKKKSSVTLTNITNNGGRKKINVATRSNANNNSGGRKRTVSRLGQMRITTTVVERRTMSRLGQT